VIRRWYEVTCDHCGGACHYAGNKESATRQAREDGWCVTEDGKHFDTLECIAAHRQERQAHE